MGGPGSTLRVAIVGGGASGTLLAVHLLRGAGRPVALHLIEATGRFGLGAAYVAAAPWHTLNVPAQLMGGWRESDADGFVRWVAANGAEGPPDSLKTSYLPRGLYGRYLQALLAAAADGRLTRVADEAVAIGRGPPFAVRLAGGATLAADAVVLCLGNFDPPPLFAGLEPGRAVERPWEPAALAAIGRDERVFVAGTGLTMIDAVLELAHRGHRGAVVAASRHGWLPAVDSLGPAYRDFFDPALAARGIVAVTRALRAEVAAAAARGIGWHPVVEAFRVHAGAIWQGLDDAGRRRFLRHLRSLWFVHRHRLPPPHAATIDRLRRAGALTILKGRIAGAGREAGQTVARVRLRGGGTRLVAADRFLNCIGPDGDYARARQPLVRALLADGLVRPDAWALGLDVDADFTLRGRDGRRVEGLHAVGPPTRGRFWEVTAVPHLRRQVEALAARLLA